MGTKILYQLRDIIERADYMLMVSSFANYTEIVVSEKRAGSDDSPRLCRICILYLIANVNVICVGDSVKIPNFFEEQVDYDDFPKGHVEDNEVARRGFIM